MYLETLKEQSPLHFVLTSTPLYSVYSYSQRLAQGAPWSRSCTSCNACVEACPIAIDPLSIIMEMRRYLVMEQSAAPNELNVMMTNVENNGAPWPFNQQDRIAWREELNT